MAKLFIHPTKVQDNSKVEYIINKTKTDIVISLLASVNKEGVIGTFSPYYFAFTDTSWQFRSETKTLISGVFDSRQGLKFTSVPMVKGSVDLKTVGLFYDFCSSIDHAGQFTGSDWIATVLVAGLYCRASAVSATKYDSLELSIDQWIAYFNSVNPDERDEVVQKILQVIPFNTEEIAELLSKLFQPVSSVPSGTKSKTAETQTVSTSA